MKRPARHGYVQDFANPRATERGANGRLLCRVCGTEVSGRRRTFCSDDCVAAWNIRTRAGFARAAVRKRDRGICALCGLDCARLKRAIRRLSKRVERAHMRAVTRILGLKRRPSTFWHMDHILPVAEGGGSCGLDNLRTLCLWCHRGETRKLRRRLQEARRLTEERAPRIIERGRDSLSLRARTPS